MLVGWTFFILGFSNANARSVGTPDLLVNRIVAIEKKTSATCAGRTSGMDPLRLEIARKMFSEGGEVESIRSEIRSQAFQANHALDHAQELVLERHKPIWESRLDRAHEQIDLHLGRLKKAKLQGLSEAVQDEIRESIKQSFDQLQSMRNAGPSESLFHDPVIGPALIKEVKDAQDLSLKQLDGMMKLNSRLEKTVEDVRRCYCEAQDSSFCDYARSDEALKNLENHHNAAHTYQDGINKAQSQATTGNNSSLSGSAR